jgi:hypothetical protein
MSSAALQHWQCPQCESSTHYRGLCRDCSNTADSVYVHRVRVNADGSPYIKANTELTPNLKGFDAESMRNHFTNARRKQKKTNKQIKAMQEAQKLDSADVAAVAEVNEVDESSGEIMFGESVEDPEVNAET